MRSCWECMRFCKFHRIYSDIYCTAADTVRHHAGLFACPKRNLLHRTGYKSGVYMSCAMALRSFVELYEQYLVTEQYDQ
jgi:hypothetical protein